ncbi:FG-GAP-like repeat-containing protein [Planctomycetes bacterium K23_9]|uniref:Tetratricopeptide repeat protein n=1 Tax=Stieleria marina TaxID=1930275 RepID=A0A517NML9_9BACT|nr:tetratricopeptide repeat protein [Planctomycetes bacterium K23_9]
MFFPIASPSRVFSGSSRWLIVLAMTAAGLLTGCDRDKQPASPVSESTTASSVVPERRENRLDQTSLAVEQGDLDKAKTLIEALLVAHPEDTDILAMAIEVFSRRKDYAQAATLAEAFATKKPESSSHALVRAFQWHLQTGDFDKAESSLEQAIQLQPNFVPARRLLAQILNAQGRRFKAAQQTRELLKLEPANPDDLLSLIDLSAPFPTVSYADYEKSPTLTILGDARLSNAQVIQRDKAKELAHSAADQFPQSQAAAAFLGRLLANTGDQSELRQWAQSIPAGTERHPEYWATLGTWLRQQQRHQEAIRAFCECLKRDATDRRALRDLIASLEDIGQSGKTLKAKQTLADLDKIYRLARNADAEQSRWIAEQLQRLGRPWESNGWLERASRIDGNLQQLSGQFAGRRKAIASWEAAADAEAISQNRINTTLGLDPEAWPLPDLAELIKSESPSSVPTTETQFALQDVANDLGIQTSFISDYDLTNRKNYLHQTNGGGLAAFDYDLDGCCDIYVAQSGGKPSGVSNANELFRQHATTAFVEMSDLAGVGDKGYSQGVCAADVNQDGWPDLLVANIGTNSLYLNQGDGTYQKVASQAFDSVDQWTSSIAVGDLDGDALPEIVEVNYVDDPTVFELACEGKAISCQPQRFRAAIDRVLRSGHAGGFQKWSAFDASPNYGFGVIIANLDGQAGNDIFISNDGDLNHLWVSEPDERNSTTTDQRFVLTESAGVRGCSIGSRGTAQACMGIALGDFDRNQKPDLHVSNFHNESVNLFLQQESGFFVDSALKLGLQNASMNVLGFGTQATDFDNDGWADLATLNGHLYDARYADIPFRMKPQMFRGGPKGFTLQDESAMNAYGQQATLGRTLATLDWNRDGRIDLLAGHLDQPIALLQNQQTPPGNWIQLQLTGVESERDAIGAEVRLTAGDQSWTAWQVGGDGYMCTNEPIIHFGIGSSPTIETVQISWPSGKKQTFKNVAVNDRYLIVENSDATFPILRPTN